MFLLPSIVVGFLFALLLGGNLSRVIEVKLRAAWTVVAALAIQVGLFSGLPSPPPLAESALHIGSYGLLLVFAVLNLRVVALLPLMTGMFLNGFVIAVNGGAMPVT